MDETTHPRRYAKACDACHRKKIRCEYSEPACKLCLKTGQRCKFTRIEKAAPQRPRRGKYLAALEERMKSMEVLLKQSNEKSPDNRETPVSVMSVVTPPAILQEQAKTMKCKLPGWATDGSHLTKPQFPAKDQAIRLAHGYFACSDHSFPIFAKNAFFQRMNNQYPPDEHSDPVWKSTVLAVLCYAHRLRAMSTPNEADAENDEACWYMMPALDLVPQLTYGKPSVARAQVLLCIASILRGTAMPEAAPMLVSAAIRMLQGLGIHRDDPLEKFSPAERRERECLFWCAYILDKDIALQTGRPPVLYEQDISRRPPSEYHDDEIGVVRSLDSSTKVDLFVASQRLAAIQGQVWSKIYSGAEPADRAMLHAAQEELNPVLAKWKAGFPFQFTKEALVCRWPKHAILQTVVLYFKYCHTLVELNKVPHMEKIDGSPLLESSCPTSKALSTYPHSSSRVATDAARDALDLASLTPRGNFQNAWLFLPFSMSAVLTLLVNALLRPLDDRIAQDLRRIDGWLRVVDILATSTGRADLDEEKGFILTMRSWTLSVVNDAATGADMGYRDWPCFKELEDSKGIVSPPLTEPSEGNYEDMSLGDLGGIHPDVFPLDFWHSQNSWEALQATGAFNWPQC